jgi:hypothetical protein
MALYKPNSASFGPVLNEQALVSRLHLMFAGTLFQAHKGV